MSKIADSSLIQLMRKTELEIVGLHMVTVKDNVVCSCCRIIVLNK